jgi:hypothetical protein
MSDTVTFVRITGSENAPAAFNPGWLPSVEGFPELAQAREDYLRLSAAYSAAGERRQELRDRIEADKERRASALRDAYLAGEVDPQAEAEDQKLKAQLAAADEQAQAAVTAFLEHINRCVALVIEHGQEWQGEITAFEQNLDGEVRALLERAAELRAKRGRYGRLEHWIQRTVEGAETPYSHFPYSDIAAPPSGDEAEEEARLREFMLASYAGGLAPDKPATPEQARRLEEGNLASQRQKPADAGGEVELNHLDDDELVDWLMGAGMFDGEAKPSAALVVDAAEEDPDMAARLLQAERTANPEAIRQDVLDALTEITNRKATV